MKKSMLLAATAVMALTMTNANADPLNLLTASGGSNLTIHPSVDLVGTFEISTNSELRFGIVLGPTVGQTITVTPQSEVYGSATLLNQTMGNSAQTKSAISSATVSAGSIKVEGDVATLLTNAGAGSVYLDFPESIDLTANNGAVTCGTVTNIPDILVPTEGDYAYGGTLEIKTATTGLHCVGNGTVTLIMNEAAAQAQNP